MLATLLGVSAAVLARANDRIVVDRLVIGRFWFDSDRAATPWGPITLLVAAAAVGVLGIVLSGALGLLVFRGRTRPTGGNRP